MTDDSPGVNSTTTELFPYHISPRRIDRDYATTTPDLVRVISWSEFSSSCASLSEWDEDIRYYEEHNDEFR